MFAIGEGLDARIVWSNHPEWSVSELWKVAIGYDNHYNYNLLYKFGYKLESYKSKRYNQLCSYNIL